MTDRRIAPRRVPIRTLLLSAALLAAPISAQEVPVAQELEEEEEEIVVTAQRADRTQVIRGGNVGILGDKPAADVPFSIKSYGAALILNQQPLTLGQVLENDPSIRTTYGFGNASEQFVIRGFTLFGDDVGYDGLYGLTPRQLVAPELYEQVQVLSGASAFLNGAAPGGSGIGGSVNLVPKRAGSGPLARGTVNYLSDGHVGGALDVGGRMAGGTIGLRVNGAYRAGEVSIDREDRSAAVVGGAFDWRSGPARVSFDLAYQRVKIRRLRPKVGIATAVLPDVPRADANYAQDFTFTTLRDIFGQIRAEYDIGSDALFYAAIGARDGSEGGLYGGLTVTDATTGAATGSAILVPRTDNNEAAQAGLRARIATGGLSHEINAGGSLIRQVNRNAFDFLAGYATNLYDTPQVARPASAFAGGNLADPFPIARTRLGSLYASDTAGALDDRVLLTVGVRRQTIDVIGYAYDTGLQSQRYDAEATSPVVGLVVKPVGGISLFANRIEGLAQGPTAPLDPRIVNGGEIFAPFRSVQYEVGAKLAGRRFNAALALYRTEQPSASAVPVDAAFPGGALRFGLNGEQRNRGIELSLDGEPVDGLRLIGGASVTGARLRGTANGATDGNRAVGVPDLQVNANAEYDLPFARGATLTSRLVHTGSQAVDTANTLELGSWTRLDLGARYVVAIAGRPLTLRLNVDNVADERYWASSFDAFGAALLQGTPRTVKLSASFALLP